VYGFEAVLPSDKAFGAPCTQNYDENEAESTRRTDIDSVEEHRLTPSIQHVRYEQQLWRYHDRNVHERDFKIGDLVLTTRFLDKCNASELQRRKFGC